MVKAIVLIKWKTGVSQEECARHYEKVHGPLAVKCFPTMKRYVQNHVIAPPGVEPEFDVMSEFWYDDMEGYQAAIDFWRSEAGQVILDDEESFMDRGKTVAFLVEEKVIK